jgi:hypothetical protein
VKRTLVSIALAASVYPALAFICLEPNVFDWTNEGRLFLVLVTLFVGGMSYAFPGWDQD